LAGTCRTLGGLYGKGWQKFLRAYRKRLSFNIKDWQEHEKHSEVYEKYVET
jgi:hypothetical protein